MMGMRMDFTVEVRKWINGAEKVWQTIGPAKMIIYRWYQMKLLVSKIQDKAHAELSVTYERPGGGLARFVSFVFADWYCKWCLSNMLHDTKTILEPNTNLKILIMKLSVLKFALSLGLAFSIGFLICNLIFLAGGHDFTLAVLNAIFHDIDFKSIMTDNGFNFGRLLGGMGALFIAGAFIGYFTAFIYNLTGRAKLS